MPFVAEVKYFNSFWLKQVVDDSTADPLTDWTRSFQTATASGPSTGKVYGQPIVAYNSKWNVLLGVYQKNYLW